MKNLVKICAMTAILALSTAPVMAQQPATPPATAAPKDAGGMMMCPMMGNMGKMQKNMASMMQDMDGMMKSTSDAAMKERMQKMRDQMGAMMSNMQKMGDGMGGMMGKGMMGQGMQGNAPASAPSAAAPADDHKAHHPDGEQK